MNILFVNNFYNIFSKADCGASQRTMCLIRALAKIGHVDVVSFVEDTISNVPNVDVIYSQYIPSVSAKEGRWSKFIKLFCKNRPYSIYPLVEQKSDVVDRIVTEKVYDFIVVRYTYYACECGLLKYKDRLLIDIDDDPKDCILMSLDKLKSKRNILYNKLYANTIDGVTKYIADMVHHSFYSTPSKNYPHAIWLPNISAYNEEIKDVSFSKSKPIILLVGRFAYYPNVEGMEHFVKEVFPIIKAAVPDVKLHIVGHIEDETIVEKYEKFDGVVLCGFVEDLVEKYRQCRCAIVPLYKGTGTSVKLVEAMSLNRPVVSTPVGVRGLNPLFEGGKDYLLAENDDDFAKNVIRLLQDEHLNRQISSSAYDKYQTTYSLKQFENIIANAIKGHK